MFKTIIILYARSFWETESRPNPGRSFPHWLAPMVETMNTMNTQWTRMDYNIVT